MSSKSWTLNSRPWKSLPQIMTLTGRSCIAAGSANEIINALASEYEDALKIRQELFELPPPTHYERKKYLQGSYNPTTYVQASNLICVVSSSRPYKVVSISDELAGLVMYSPEDVCGRSINMLQGPSTDVQKLHIALKAADSCPLPATLYTSRGIELNIVLVCIAGGDSTLSIHIHPQAQSRCPLSSLPATDRALRRKYQEQYRFRAGLVIQQTVNRRGASPKSARMVPVD